VIPEQTATRGVEPTFFGASELASAGYRVFPVGQDKSPSVTGGFYAATRDQTQIAAWIQEGRGDHDIAMPTGLVTLTVVIDADTAEAYAEMQANHGEPHVTTKRGGHWYFRHPQDGKATSRRVAPGLDCKADGGYVVVPPSRNRTWTRGIPELEGLEDLPKALKRMVRGGGRLRLGPGVSDRGRADRGGRGSNRGRHP
jgi:hypothetical protein